MESFPSVEEIDSLPYHILQAEAGNYSIRRNLSAAKLRRALQQTLTNNGSTATLPQEWLLQAALDPQTSRLSALSLQGDTQSGMESMLLDDPSAPPRSARRKLAHMEVTEGPVEETGELLPPRKKTRSGQACVAEGGSCPMLTDEVLESGSSSTSSSCQRSSGTVWRAAPLSGLRTANDAPSGPNTEVLHSNSSALSSTSKVLSLPFEILVEMLEHVTHTLPENIQDPKSSTYWALNRFMLDKNTYHSANIKKSLLAAREPFLLFNRTFHAAMTMALQNPRVFRALDAEKLGTAQQHTANERQKWGPAWGLEHLGIRMTRRMLPTVSNVVRDHVRTLKSLTLYFSAADWGFWPRDFWPSFYSLPNLRTFVYRTCNNSLSIKLETVLEIMAGAPHLVDLTIFRLQGIVLVPEDYPTHSSKLRSLHIRGLSHVSGDGLRFLLSNSHETLQEVTFLFEVALWRFDPTTADYMDDELGYRGISTSSVQAAFSPCVAIRILRVGDMVGEDAADPKFLCPWDVHIQRPQEYGAAWHKWYWKLRYKERRRIRKLEGREDLNEEDTRAVEGFHWDSKDSYWEDFSSDEERTVSEDVDPDSEGFHSDDEEIHTDDEGQDSDDEGQDSDDEGQDSDDEGQDLDDEELHSDDEGQDLDDEGQDSDDEGQDSDDEGQHLDDEELHPEGQNSDDEVTIREDLLDWIFVDNDLYDHALDKDHTSLATMVDGMVQNLAQLETLEISGVLCSTGLFESLRRSGCVLRELTIYRYPDFPLAELVEQMRANNPALAQLRVLTFGYSLVALKAESPAWAKLEQLCKQRHIDLRECHLCKVVRTKHQLYTIHS